MHYVRYIEVMYIAAVPNRNSPPAFLLRESFRQKGRVKNRTLANLSRWPAARIEALRRLLRGEFDQAADLSLAPQLGPVFGLLLVLKRIAEALGLAAVLGHSRLAKLGLFLVLARVAHQGSRLSAVRWAEDQAVAEVLGLGKFDEADLYGALDDLATQSDSRTDAIELIFSEFELRHPDPEKEVEAECQAVTSTCADGLD